jgi:hypothetical protein
VPFQLVMSRSSPSSKPYEHASVALLVYMFRRAERYMHTSS